MGFLTSKKANSNTPQIITLIVDDSGSMQGEKAKQATEALQDMVIQIQSLNLGAGGFRYLLNVAKFGDFPTPIADAAAPAEVNLGDLAFAGESGTTEMAPALTWASEAMGRALDRCRKNPNFREADAPPPLVVFFSDGANTGPDVGPAAGAVKGFASQSGTVDVVACGIGMEQGAFPVMQTIASRPDLAMNIDPAKLADFIAEVKATVLDNTGVERLITKGREIKAAF